MKAVKKFNVDKGVRLVSYAIFWIKAEIQEYVVKNWRLVKNATTKAQRKLFFNLRSMKKTLQKTAELATFHRPAVELPVVVGALSELLEVVWVSVGGVFCLE